MKVDAIEEGARNLAAVAADLGVGAGAVVLLRAEIATRVRIPNLATKQLAEKS
jgi:predicted RNA methylase